MSLVVWLPLNGNLDNYGVSGVTVSNSGATVNPSGKLGQCYSFANSNYLQLNNVPFSNLTTCSVSFWFYLNNQEDWLPCTGQSGSYYFMATSGGTGGFYHQNVGSSTITIYRDGVIGTTPLGAGSWHHYTITGLNLSSWTAFRINMYSSTSSGWNWTGKMNDFRIYDHILSKKEVQEIYSTLLMHYELDDEYVENTTNLASHSKTSHNGFGIVDGNNLLSTGSSTGYQTGESYVVRILKASGNLTCGYSSYRKGIATTSGSSYTFSFKYKMLSGSESQLCGHWNGGNGVSLSVSDAGDGWKYAYFTQSATASSTNLGVGFNGSGTLDVLITEIQFEKNNHPTPFTLTTRTSSIVYDNSGYKYDAIGNGITTSTDTPRYRHSYVFDGTTSYIEIPAAVGPVFDSDYTMCFWIKGTSDNGTRSVYFGSGTSAYTLNIEKTSGNSLRFYNASHPDYSVSGFSLTDNEWIHVAIVKSGTSVNFYRNGAFIGSTSGLGTHSSYDIKYYLGRDHRAQSSGVWFSGKMSDFRLYATALSANDVYWLSETSASIDKNGRLHSYEFIEDGNKTKVEKQGIVLSGTIIEDSTGKTRFGKDSSIYSTEFIEW